MADNNTIKRTEQAELTPAAGVASYEQVQKEHKAYFNIVKKRYLWFALSALLLIPSIISLAVQGLNLGIDFTGGTMLDIQFNQKVTQAQITESLDSVGLTGQVQLSQEDTEALIRTEALDPEKRDALLASIKENAGEFDSEKLGEDLVGPAIGAELRTNAFKALIVATILILAYVTLRFRLIYAIGGIVALAHDILITLGIFSIFQWQVEAAFIAAILTVFGYSINDTVVIYDRMRENEKRLKKRDSYEDMVDKSVWQSMERSVKTSMTVLIALFAIFILGGASTKVFALAMIIGVTTGTYSSIFIASQIVVELRKRFRVNITKKEAQV
ncbi:MAG: preprotein translocase subunit SecF [Gracilibacter sp. BRH_c7a]|nr:MAG: preprotein translocase subunit SecF [Gracilibacter sp. BRH_c7a]